MRLYLIRHAESENNVKPNAQRIDDPPLTAVGRLQAEYLAKWALTLNADVLITSPFLRTLDTTRAILSVKPQPVQVWSDIFETGGCHHGYDQATFAGSNGLGRDAIRERLATHEHDCIVDETISPLGWWGGKPRETEEETRQRAARLECRLRETFGNQRSTVAAVTHADFKSYLLKTMMPQGINFDALGLTRNTAVTRIDWIDGQWHLQWFGSVTHLPDRLITGPPKLFWIP